MLDMFLVTDLCTAFGNRLCTIRRLNWDPKEDWGKLKLRIG